MHLRQDCRLSVSAIKGYKSMLNSVFRYKGFDLSADPVLQEIVSACNRQHLKQSAALRRGTWMLFSRR